MQKIIGIDVDDTCFDLMSAWLDVYNYDYRDNLKREHIKSWAVHEYVYAECGYKIYDYLISDLYYDVFPIDDAQETIEFLRELNYRIVFVTSAHPLHFGRKFSLLNQYGFNVELEDYIEAKDKSLLCVDYLIDDRDLNIRNARGQGIVFSQPWNSHLSGYPRMNNWKQIQYYFANIKKLEIIGG